MDGLMKELRTAVTGNPDIAVLQELHWGLPVVSYDVQYSRVKQFRMDILMKMLLLTFQEAEIQRPAALAEMLLVEELFVQGLMEKMTRTHLIVSGKNGYRLTAKGLDHLEKGVFEEEVEPDGAIITYSPVHDQYTLGEVPHTGEELPLYRYAREREADLVRMDDLLAATAIEAEADGYEITAAGIMEWEERSRIAVPCIEFRLHDRRQDIFFARVWNGLTNGWDEVLEKELAEKEAPVWREEFLQAP